MSTDTIPCPRADEMEISAVLHALADPVRLDMVRQLAGCADVACGGFEVSVGKSTLTHHLRILREAGVISTRQRGTTRLNSLRRKDLDEAFPGLLDAVLTAGR
ncbi:helix-turn-helix domain-containing protein [Amycolatopsis cynarae]|uniref:Helix-turn-helix domain-containing protein n=1 Tax=Amycolatopsis cynarae TaxID=2995223 RepID=A0ABY7B1G8_9PSEU|nr:ArsR family transcriptional regulator [Amycolatopsis sp. HUAS 11-8]WAL65047.1 helix-turn-helix domain-containing protein [Amycolatopsis sp. HUAS 11-8]